MQIALLCTNNKKMPESKHLYIVEQLFAIL